MFLYFSFLVEIGHSKNNTNIVSHYLKKAKMNKKSRNRRYKLTTFWIIFSTSSNSPNSL